MSNFHYCDPAIEFRRSLEEIASDYPQLDLLDRNIHQWLKEREYTLADRAKYRRHSNEATKVTSVFVGVASLLWISSPLAPLTAVAVACSYLMSVFQDFDATGKVYPLPLSREPIGEIIQGMMSDEYRGYKALVEQAIPESRRLLLTRYSYLDIRDQAEAFMLLHNYEIRLKGDIAPLDTILAQAPIGHRFLVYLRLLTEYMNRKSFEFTEEEIFRLYDYLPEVESQPQIPPSRVSPAPVNIASTVEIPASKPEPVDYEIPDLSAFVPTVPIAPPSQPIAPTQPKDTGLSMILKNPFESRAIFGRQRSGKSHLAAVATQRLAEQGVKIFHLNLASVGNEDDRYWRHATRSIRADLSFMEPSDAMSVIADSISVVQEFVHYPEAAILIVDEITILGRETHGFSSELDPLIALLSSVIGVLVSNGIKRKKAIWTISPDLVAGGLSKSARLAVKDLALVIVSVSPWHTIEWQGSQISFDQSLLGQLQKNYAGVTMPPNSSYLSSSERIAMVQGKWYPLGVGHDSLKVDTVQGSMSYLPIANPPDDLAVEFRKHIQ